MPKANHSRNPSTKSPPSKGSQGLLTGVTIAPPKITTKRLGPLWLGPEKDGVTFSMLSRFLVCRERFRVHVIEGLRPQPGFNHRIEFGQMWHDCEEAHAKSIRSVPERWETALLSYCQELAKLYPMDAAQIDHWYNVCKVTFPEYVKFWSKHKDVTTRVPLLQEQVFDVPYELPSGRVVRLRGKWDSVDLIGTGKNAAVYLKENKTKGEVVEAQILRQLTFDLQTMMYLVALKEWGSLEESLGPRGSYNVGGVIYNVVRRPLSGGKGSIVRKKGSKKNPLGESKEAYYKRVASYIKENPQEYFMRWKVEVSPQDILNFRRRCLDPILEQLCWWYEDVTADSDESPGQRHRFNTAPPSNWQHPFGVRNILDEGGSSDLDEYLSTGSTVGLVRQERLFEELT